MKLKCNTSKTWKLQIFKVLSRKIILKQKTVQFYYQQNISCRCDFSNKSIMKKFI